MDAKDKTQVEEIVKKLLAETESEVEIPDEIANLPKQFKETKENLNLSLTTKAQELEKAIHKVVTIVEDLNQKINVKTTREVLIKTPKNEKGKKIKLCHKQFEDILSIVSSRDINGYPTPLWLYGAAGGGKTTLVRQIADALDMQFLPIVFGPTTTDTKVIGFMNAAHGQYVTALGRRWYEEGGLFLCGEIDNAEPSALVSLNMLVAQDEFLFPDGKLIKKHKDCYIIADANTLGTGASDGYRRQSQDAASRSRWFKYKLEYDEVLETKLAPILSWTSYVQKVRKALSKVAKTSIKITPRDSILGSAALRNGVRPELVIAHLFAEFSEDARKQVINEVGEYKMTEK